MNIIWQEVALHTKLFFRDRQAVFWGFVFPVLLLILFCSVFGGSSERTAVLVAGVICINSMSGALFGTGVVTVSAREQGVLRRYKVAPVALWKIIFGLCVSRLIAVTLTTIVLIILARVVYKVQFPVHIGAMVLIFVTGTMMFCAIAFAIASIAKSVAQANGMVQVVFMPMMFLSGATLPHEFLPGWMQKLSNILPSTYYVSGLKGTMMGQTGIYGNIENLIFMSLYMAFATVVSLRFFRWE
jgi:ABC-2 type transport system permease protein